MMEIENGHKIYCCYECDYYTSKKNHYTRHLMTAKHKNRLNGNYYGKEKGQKGATCNMCLKTFKSSSGLWKHKQKCNIQEKIEEKIEEIQEETKETELKSMIVKIMTDNTNKMNILMNENQELRNQLKEQNKQITELIPKVGNNNNTLKQKFNINVFLNEKCKDALSMDEFINTIQISVKNLLTTKSKGLCNGINEIINENMNKLSVYERPIHCTDKKREILYIKNKTWEKDSDKTHTNRMLKALQSQQFKAMKEWIKENPNYQEDENLKHEYMMLVNKCSSSLNEHEKKLFKSICESTYLKDENI